MSRWREHSDELDHSEMFDPLCVERTAPMDDEEAELAKALCQSATPGPLVIDDTTNGEGAIVATLPDGRHIVSLTASVQHTQDRVAIEANARLFCKTKNLLLRLLRDRQQWRHQQQFLEERIRTLETALESERAVTQGEGWQSSQISTLPR